VFPARYELNSYIVFRKRLVSKRLMNLLVMQFSPASCHFTAHVQQRLHTWLWLHEEVWETIGVPQQALVAPYWWRRGASLSGEGLY
jgi:hypothetical protein